MGFCNSILTFMGFVFLLVLVGCYASYYHKDEISTCYQSLQTSINTDKESLQVQELALLTKDVSTVDVDQDHSAPETRYKLTSSTPSSVFVFQSQCHYQPYHLELPTSGPTDGEVMKVKVSSTIKGKVFVHMDAAGSYMQVLPGSSVKFTFSSADSDWSASQM